MKNVCFRALSVLGACNVFLVSCAFKMLHLQHISLVQFKNYSNHTFNFAEKITAICGKNGVGKTNLLDAIHYLCFTKSYFTRLDVNNVQHGNSGFRLAGNFKLSPNPDSYREEKALCILRETGRKEFSVNDDAYDKFSHHIGRYPCVVIAPDDAELITGDSKERRKFLDALLCQLDADYLQHLIVYKKILEQRNSLLKSFVETGVRNFELLDVLDEQLIKPGSYIFNKRSVFLDTFLPVAKNLYREISRQPTGANSPKEVLTNLSAMLGNEDVKLLYESELSKASFSALLKINRAKDCLAQRTTSGIHRDDLVIQLNDQPFKNIASQGQRKSLLFALKLAEMEILKQAKKFAPLLLLDDVFEKLDEERISNLLHRVCVENTGQVFITDTNKDRLRLHLENLSVNYQLIILEDDR